MGAYGNTVALLKFQMASRFILFGVLWLQEEGVQIHIYD
jgi:hypothetical protein